MDLIHRLSGLVVRHLPPERFAALRRRWLAWRARGAALTRVVYWTFDTAALREHLEEHLTRDFEVLMVHSSINGMLPMYTGSPLELVRMLVDFCGPERTLAMPAFYFGDPKIGGLVQTYRRNPVFDLRRVPSQMGLATELFRRLPGVLQSRHPAYRVAALGPLAQELTEGHERAVSAAGLGSPFARMAARDTLILGIGKSFQVMTQVHHVEDLMGDAFPVPRRPVEQRAVVEVDLIDADLHIPVMLVSSGLKWRFNIDRLPGLLAPGDLDLWKFHGMPLFAADARCITERLIEAAKRGRSLYERP